MKKTWLPLFIAALSLATIFSSCSRTITCEDGAIQIFPVGFSKKDFDSAYAVRYKPDNFFDSVVDTGHYVYYSQSYNDTGNMHVVCVGATSYNYNGTIISGYDYKIFLPAIGKIYSITKVVQQGNKMQSYSQGLFDQKMVTCTNSVISCDLDGTPVTSAPNKQSMLLYIVK